MFAIFGNVFYGSLATNFLKMAYVDTIHAMVTTNPLQTGMYVMPQPRSRIPRIASQANVCGKMYAIYLKTKNISEVKIVKMFFVVSEKYIFVNEKNPNFGFC